MASHTLNSNSVFMNRDVGSFAVIASDLQNWRQIASVFWSTLLQILIVYTWSKFYLFSGDCKLSFNDLTSWWYLSILCIFRIGLLFIEHQLGTVRSFSTTADTFSKRPFISSSNLKNQLTWFWYRLQEMILLAIRNYTYLLFLAVQMAWGVASTICFMQLLMPLHDSVNSLFRECLEEVDSVSCVDDQYLFVIMFGAFQALFLGLHYLYHTEFQLHFPPIQQARWFRFKECVPYVLSKAMLLSLVGMMAFYVVYFLLNMQLSTAASSVLSWIFSAKIPVESTAQLDIVILMRLFACGVFQACCFYFPNHIEEIIHTEAFSFDLHNSKNEYLLEGLAFKQSPLVQYLAFLDLYTLASFSFHRRSYLFNDETGETWKQVMNRCCDVIDTVTTSIYNIKKIEKNEQPPIPTSHGGIKPSIAVKLKSMLDNAMQPKPSVDPFDCLQLQLWAIDALSTLVTTSLKEDRIGVVQNTNSLPQILNSMVACLIAVEELYIQSPLGLHGYSGLATSKYPYRRLEGYQLVRTPPHALSTALNTAIYRICTAFYENLLFFKFPPKYAAKLQSFMDFKE